MARLFHNGPIMEYSTNPKEIGRRLKEMRIRAGMSIIDVSGAIRVARQTLYRWERGDEMPRANTYFRLIELYDPLDPASPSQ